ncbi:ABC transporter substrate-binding protein [Lacisediminihabitans changchengi]|uniref:Peptide ABC transporter substrate-binding protein n=1 Tax=Lacisediminihabitans changchengi TaxID=2787634 RepID=A0A934W2X0_9MICO|nr:ABC transporter substrate-binding protein [Lacisediminihabitans changchengi]MBK4346624.1 peptide ABC transporter substrate-binding protein [Lacisediminihabitans changchengi]
MTSASIFRKRSLALLGVAAVAAITLAGCSAGGANSNNAASTPLTIGTTDKVTVLDPAGSYDNGSFAVQNQVFPFLFNTPYGSPDVQPDIAVSGDFTSPTEFTVKLKPNLKFANGDKLTSSDVKFTFDRDLKIADENGPSSLLYNLASVAAPDATTVVFTLKQANDQVFKQILSSPAGPIVDEQVFPADKLLSDNDIVKSNAFAGQYTIKSYNFNNLISYKANPNYDGVLGKAKTDVVNVKYYTSQSNLKLDVQKGDVDVAFRSLSPTDVSSLEKEKNVTVYHGPGGEIRYFVFNFQTAPYGTKTPDANPAKALAVRQAAADLVDRDALSKDVYKGTYSPLYSYVPDGLTGATTVLKDLYGNGKGGPDESKAKKTLQDAGVTTPIKLDLQYNTDHYGESSSDEYAALKSELETGGLFSVNLQSTEYVQYSKDRKAGVYSVFQLGWFPDYSDADNYLTPFFYNPTDKEAFILNHYDNPTVDGLILKQGVTSDKAERAKIIEEIQADVAADLPTIPLLQGDQVAVAGKDVKGIKDTLDASFKFRYGALSK